MYRYIPRESCSQFDSLPLTSLTISPRAQDRGVRWLVENFAAGRSCILADEMGLGKTIQVTALFHTLATRMNNKGPFLVVAPLSTIEHWRRTVEGWTNMNCCFYYDGAGRGGHTGRDNRKVIRDYEWFYHKVPDDAMDDHDPEALAAYRCRNAVKFNVLITTYEVFQADAEYFSQLTEHAGIRWEALVVDEGHKIRNMKSKLLGLLQGLRVRWRLLLTGTPLQNNLGELWTLLNFIAPRDFEDREGFLRRFGTLATAGQVKALLRDIRPHMLRRLKEDVEKNIPTRDEGECSFIYRYIPRESCSQFDSLPLTYLTK